MPTSAREEAVRKAVHVLLSLVAAVVVWTAPPVPAAAILAGATTLALLTEVARRASGSFARGFHRHLGPLLRDREDGRLTGATTLSIGYTTVAVLLPGDPALVGILVAGVADAVAAVVGKRFGRIRYPGGKSLEGSIAFLIVVLPLLLTVPGLGAGPAVLTALFLTLVEAPALTVDDNLYLPVTAGLAVQGALLLPGLTFFS